MSLKNSTQVFEPPKPRVAFIADFGKRKVIGVEHEFTLPSTSLVEGKVIDVEFNVLNKQQLNSSTFISVAEASEQFGISPDKIRRLCRQERLQAYKEGKFWKISVKSIRNFLK